MSPPLDIPSFLASEITSIFDSAIPPEWKQRPDVTQAKSSLSSFTSQSWHIVEPQTPLVWNWHLDEICEVLHAVHEGSLKRVIINLPPGFMKSFMCSVMLNAWEWTTDPSLRYLTFSYSDANTIRDNRRVRDIVTSEWYRSRFGVQLSPDQQGKIRFDTTAKGWRIASSVGGMGTGEHPDRIIIDDPMKADDARSQTTLESVSNWIDQTVSTRVARDPAIILVMQRLHMDDLTGHLIAKGGWEHVVFPMHWDPLRADRRDHRYKVGELLWPEKWPEDRVKEEENLLGEFGRSGQLEQSPIPEGGALFKREWFKIVDKAPAIADRVRGWDTADTENGGDYTYGVKISKTSEGLFFVEHTIGKQLGPAKVNQLIINTAKVDGPLTRIREGSGSGKATINARSISLQGYDYLPSQETVDKITRANPFRAQAEAGNVYLVRGEWNEAYLDVVCNFPYGRYDDAVDASSNAINELTGNLFGPKKIEVTW